MTRGPSGVGEYTVALAKALAVSIVALLLPFAVTDGIAALLLLLVTAAIAGEYADRTLGRT